MKYIIIALILIVLLAGSIFVWQGIYLPKEPGSKQPMVFSVKKGDGAREIALNLQNQGVIKYGPLFRIYVFIRGTAKKLQAGDYALTSGMPIPEITDKLVIGDTIKQKITIIEGWSLEDISAYLESELGYPFSLTQDFSQEFDFLKDKPKSLSLEGYLFPDTYEIPYGAGAEEITRKILSNFGKKLTGNLRQGIASQKKTIFEIVTMASLIEKEVKTPQDRKIVSGILWKRLQIGMPLQVDATIIYITGKKTVDISLEETKINSPYNTYKYKGLPLGPICSPGLDSIQAAIYSQASNYLYYLSTPDGTTIFSKTLEEHNAAKAQYLK